MAIKGSAEYTLAEVEVTDAYDVDLTMIRRKVTFSPEQACDLGRELWKAGLDARRMQREDSAAFVAPVAVSGEQVL